MTTPSISTNRARATACRTIPFNAIVGPRPIGWIASAQQRRRANLAPYSFFNAFNYTPPIIGFASIGWKDSVRNIEETGEFAWNLATRPLAEQMNQTCAAVAARGRRIRAGRPHARALAPGRACRAWRRARCSFECRLTPADPAAGAPTASTVPTWLVLGEVVGVHIARALLMDGVYDTAAAQPILRGGGPADYFEIGPDSLFRMCAAALRRRALAFKLALALDRRGGVGARLVAGVYGVAPLPALMDCLVSVGIASDWVAGCLSMPAPVWPFMPELP